MSSTVRLDSTSDFIQASEACIIQLEQPKPTTPPPRDEAIRIHSKPTSSLPGQTAGGPPASSKVQIALADCLACSGCVTSAEEVLIEQHGTENLKKVIEDITGSLADGDRKVLVASVAPQVIADMCVFYEDPDVMRTFTRIFTFLTEHAGFQYVLSTESAEDLSAYAVSAEYLERTTSSSAGPLPLLTSACPGFTCYMEKQHPSLMPFLSSVMSQQSIFGVLVQKLFAEASSEGDQPFFHLSIQPCFDRKLEASRKENAIGTHFVLSALELGQWMEAVGHIERFGAQSPTADLSESELFCDTLAAMRSSLEQRPKRPAWIRLLMDVPHPVLDAASPHGDRRIGEAGKSETDQAFAVLHRVGPTSMEGSGAFHASVLLMKWLAARRFERAPPVLRYRTRRNQNHQEVYVEANADAGESTEPAPFVTIMYGFQHIQNLTRSLRKLHGNGRTQPTSSAQPYSDFVEVMACPGGCLNGSAQKRKDLALMESQPYLQRVKERYTEWKEVSQQCGPAGSPMRTVRFSLQAILDSFVTVDQSQSKRAPTACFAPFMARWAQKGEQRMADEKPKFLTTADIVW